MRWFDFQRLKTTNKNILNRFIFLKSSTKKWQKIALILLFTIQQSLSQMQYESVYMKAFNKGAFGIQIQFDTYLSFNFFFSILHKVLLTVRMNLKVLLSFLFLSIIVSGDQISASNSEASRDIQTIKTLVTQIFQWYKNEMTAMR
jgi:hypothetical protein